MILPHSLQKEPAPPTPRSWIFRLQKFVLFETLRLWYFVMAALVNEFIYQPWKYLQGAGEGKTQYSWRLESGECISAGVTPIGWEVWKVRDISPHPEWGEKLPPGITPLTSSQSCLGLTQSITLRFLYPDATLFTCPLPLSSKYL